jgi:molecular chaperone GrpE
MVKKKSHEERHDEPVPGNEAIEYQENAEREDSEPVIIPGDPEPESNPAAEEELTKKLTEMQDRYLRLSAEFDTYRKRTLREKMELARSGGESVIVSLLPVIDDFDRALNSMRDMENSTAIKQGLELISIKISDFLQQNGVREIEVLHEPFNSDLQEAVSGITVEDETLKGKVIEVIRKGYTLNEKVIRFPKVVVGE